MTAIFNASQARENFAEVIQRSAIEEVFIKRHNETIAVVVSPVVWEKVCQAYEDLSDYTAALEVLNDPNEIAELEAIRRELGL